MPSACTLTPPPPCLSGPYGNYDIVEFSLDNGATWISPNFVTNDSYYVLSSIGGINWHIQTDCGTITPNMQALSIWEVSNPSNSAQYNPFAFNSSYPATWTFKTTAGHPTGWPLTQILIRTKCDGELVSSGQVTDSFVSSVVLPAISGFRPGDSLFCWFNQGGTSQGGSIVLPTFPAGWTLLHSSTGHDNSLWFKANSSSGSSTSVTALGTPDNIAAIVWASRTRPSTSIISSLYKDAQPSSTSLSSGSISFTGDYASIFSGFRSNRSQSTSFTPQTFSAPSGGFTMPFNINSFDGRAPPFNCISSCFLQRSSQIAGTYTAGVTNSASLSWASFIVAIR
jgi:hypothetical protein